MKNVTLHGLPLKEAINVNYDIDMIMIASSFKERAEFLSSILREKRYDVVIDLGAGIGEVSAWAAKNAKSVMAC